MRPILDASKNAEIKEHCQDDIMIYIENSYF
jgi:hypothetical protein